jgi:hypothetical protein
VIRVYEEIVEFIAAGTIPDSVAQLGEPVEAEDGHEFAVAE